MYALAVMCEEHLLIGLMGNFADKADGKYNAENAEAHWEMGINRTTRVSVSIQLKSIRSLNTRDPMDYTSLSVRFFSSIFCSCAFALMTYP